MSSGRKAVIGGAPAFLALVAMVVGVSVTEQRASGGGKTQDYEYGDYYDGKDGGGKQEEAGGGEDDDDGGLYEGFAFADEDGDAAADFDDTDYDGTERTDSDKSAEGSPTENTPAAEELSRANIGPVKMKIPVERPRKA